MFQKKNPFICRQPLKTDIECSVKQRGRVKRSSYLKPEEMSYKLGFGTEDFITNRQVIWWGVR